MVGQRAVVETLQNAVRMDRLSHGLLFVGPRGTGKTSTARILAKAVNCTDLRDGEPCDACPSCVSIREGRAMDVIELDAASNNRVDDMRELVPRVYTAAADLRRKVFIIDEVQRIKEGWDVLLKTLEEPPDGVLFIFCTTDPSQIRPAVVSRLQRFTFRPLTIDGDRGQARPDPGVARDGSPTPDALELIARLAAGGMRDAESLLDQVLATSDAVIDAQRCATCWAWRRRPPSSASWMRSPRATRSRASTSSTSWKGRVGTSSRSRSRSSSACGNVWWPP